MPRWRRWSRGSSVGTFLEYGLASAAVAVGWSGSLNEFLSSPFGIELPAALASPPGDGGVFNLPAVLIVAGVTVLFAGGPGECPGQHDHGH